MSLSANTPARPSTELLAVAVAAAGSICVGTVPYLVRLLQTDNFDTVSLLFWRYVFGCLVLLPLAFGQLLRAPTPEPATRAKWGLYIGGIWGSLQTFAYYKAIETVSTSVAVTLFFAYPIMTLLLDRMVLGIQVPRSTLLAIAAIFVGVVLTSLPQLQSARVASIDGLILASLTPLLYAVYITFSYGMTRQLPTFVAAALIYAGQLSAFTAAVLVLGLRWPSSATEWLLVCAIGTVGGAVQVASFAYALPRLSASGYAVIVSLELVTVILIGVAVLGERLSPTQRLGVALVVTGVLVDRLLRAWSRRTTPIRR